MLLTMQLNAEHLDLAVHAVEALSILGVGLGGIIKLGRKLDRLLGIFETFPPHLHDNGRIVYPKGYEPPQISRMNGEVKP